MTEDNSSVEGGVTVIEVTKPNMAQKGIIKVSKMCIRDSFCSPRVMDILARELNLPLTAIRKNEKGSEIVFGKTK